MNLNQIQIEYGCHAAYIFLYTPDVNSATTQVVFCTETLHMHMFEPK